MKNTLTHANLKFKALVLVNTVDMAIESGYIESLQESVVKHDVQFITGNLEAIAYNREHPEITELIMITKQTCIDEGYTIYNPKAAILAFLN
ncbi:hypothetical protein [Hufsiella ginkgonis]|uniref:Uncharacterized protein n=1 Tax=Hufsiella ginkgonis TaxID=2695274 RepID=A0A7K1XRY5_9SPHI|nr:hypothetical protein [Hufsiella ginkgonis]MXV13710.1 hypothetical protein [Hufsiella ginkgonis]